MLNFLRRRCRHSAIPDFSQWRNTASGTGYYVSKCRRCGTEMTKPQVGGWRPIAFEDRK